MWFLYVCCEEPVAKLNTKPVDFIGVDRGMVNPATTSDGINYSGRKLTRYQRWAAKMRAELQAKQTRSAKRLMVDATRRPPRTGADGSAIRCKPAELYALGRSRPRS